MQLLLLFSVTLVIVPHKLVVLDRMSGYGIFFVHM